MTDRKIVRTEWVGVGATQSGNVQGAVYVLVYYPDYNQHCAYFGLDDADYGYEGTIGRVADWGSSVRQNIAEAVFDTKFQNYGPL